MASRGKRAAVVAAAALVLAGTGRAPAQEGPGGMNLSQAAPDGGSSSLSSELRAQVNPVQYTTLAATRDGRIDTLPLRPGDRFDKGDQLAAFICDEARARLAKARAALERARRKARVQKELADLGSTSGLKVAVTRAKVDEARADRRVRKARVAKCTIEAPFDGAVAELHARPGESLKAGDKLMKIVNPDKLQVELIVPSRWLRWLDEGRTFRVKVHETGKTYPVRVTTVAPWIDAVSQSVKIFAAFAEGADDLLPGMSGRALLSPPDKATGRPNG